MYMLILLLFFVAIVQKDKSEYEKVAFILTTSVYHTPPVNFHNFCPARNIPCFELKSSGTILNFVSTLAEKFGVILL